MRRTAQGLAACTSATLLAMIAVSVVTGASQEAHEWYRAPDAYAAGLLAHASGLRLLFGLDVAFLVLYALFFAALAAHLRRRGASAVLVWLALGAMLGTAVLDIIEDHHILSLLGVAEAGRPIDDASIVFQQTLSSTKFSLSYLALFAFGLSVPRATKLGLALSLVLTIGTLATAILGFAAPPDWRSHLDAGRWVGFLLGFALAAAWLRTEPDA